jgi:hypothetical protein
MGVVVKKLIGASVALLAISMAPFAAAAAPKTGCPATSARWTKYSVVDAGMLLFEEVGAWDSPKDAIAEIDQRFNRNHDEDVCLAMRWGDDLNPKSNWSGFDLYLVADNNANATQR